MIRQRVDNRWALLALMTLIALVGYVTFDLSYARFPPFDVAYNFLSYKNLVDHGWFGSRYGLTQVPFDPIVSTGPPVNIFIALGYALSDPSEGIYWGTALVNLIYMLALCLMIAKLYQPLCAFFVILAGVMAVYLTPRLTLHGALFTGFGEQFGVIFVFFGFIIIRRFFGSKIAYLGWICLGLALLTKINLIVGLVLPLAVMLFNYLRENKKHLRAQYRPIMMKSILIMACLAGPDFFYKQIMTRALLDKTEFQAYESTKKNWNKSVKSSATYNWKQFVLYIKTQDTHHLEEIHVNIKEKAEELINFHNGKMPLVLLGFSCISVLFLTASLRYKKHRHLFDLTLFAIGFGCWWFFLNKANWFRYFSPTALSLIIVFANVFGIELTRLSYKQLSRNVLLRSQMLISTAIVILLIVTYLIRLPDNSSYKQLFASEKSLKDTLAKMAYKVGQDKTGIYFGWGWFQSPELRSITRADFYDITNGEGVDFAISSGRNLYFVTGPLNFSAVPDLGDRLQAMAATVQFKEGDWGIYQLDATKLKPQ